MIKSRKTKICLACTHGGHLGQMMRLLDAFESHDYFFVTYKSETSKNLKNAYLIPYKYGIIYTRIIWLLTIFIALFILIKERPKIIVSTGGGDIAIPFCYMAKLLNIKIIYIESIARINTVSLGAKLIYPIADLFLVQWESLLKYYGNKAKYWGRVI